jgi:hypothetical protein
VAYHFDGECQGELYTMWVGTAFLGAPGIGPYLFTNMTGSTWAIAEQFR